MLKMVTLADGPTSGVNLTTGGAPAALQQQQQQQRQHTQAVITQ
jgi:hypothetical protein